MHPRLALDPSVLEAFCHRHAVRRLRVFGSALRADFDEGSDIDLLVEFAEGAVPTLFSMAVMEEELAGLLPTARRIDLRTPDDLSRYFRESVLRQAVPLRLPPEDQVRLRHMLDAAREAVSPTGGRAASSLDSDPMLLRALVQCVTEIGEAGNRVTETTQDLAPQVP